MRKFNTLLMAMLMLLILLLQGCSSQSKDSTTDTTNEAIGESEATDESEAADESEETDESTTAAGDLKIVLLLPGEINDQGWNASNYAGLIACNEDLGTNMEYIENVQPSDFESTMREYAERGYDMILAAGSQFDEAAATVGAEYPDTMFSMVNGSRVDIDNLAPIFPREYEASYIAGIIAGYTSENGKFAMIGGDPNQAMENLMSVYGKTAVEYATQRGITGSKYTIAYANSWDDSALGKEMASSMIDDGADVFFSYANSLSLGCIDAAVEKGIKYIGYAADQTVINEETVIASVDFDFAQMYKWAIGLYLDGELTGGTLYEAGINQDIFVPIYTDNVDEECKESVEAAIAEYKTGSVDLTALFD